MKILITILKVISLALVLISIVFFIYSIWTFAKAHCSTSIFDNIYSVLARYAGIYKFTFIVCAFWATLRQLKISQDNYNNTLEQIQLVQKRDITGDTLKQCNFYLQELQMVYKELIETNTVSGLFLEWPLLNPITSATLQNNYPHIYERFENIDRPIKNRILIILYKFEAFSSLFIHGNLDKQLAHDIIGDTYTKQVGFLLSFISYFRHEPDGKFGINIIKLYNEWHIE